MWFGAGDVNFYRMRDGIITKFTKDGQQTGVGAVQIEATHSAIRKDARGNIWTSGLILAILNPQTGDFQKFSVADGLPSNQIRSIF